MIIPATPPPQARLVVVIVRPNTTVVCTHPTAPFCKVNPLNVAPLVRKTQR